MTSLVQPAPQPVQPLTRPTSPGGGVAAGPARPALGDGERETVRGDRRTARVVGVLYLAGMAVGIPANVVAQSMLGSPSPASTIAASSMLLAVAVVGWLATVVGDAAHGVLMFPILRRRSERGAVGYLAARIVDAVFIAVMALLIVVQIPVGAAYLGAGADASYLQALSAVLADASQYAYEFGMTAVGVAGLILCSRLLRARLLPKALAVWGLVGYAILLGGSLLEILGFHLSSVQAGVGGLWEVFIGVWLIVKGFNPPRDAAGTGR